MTLKGVVIPAPEEYITFAEFRAACVPDFSTCNKQFTTTVTGGRWKSLHAYYTSCWAQAEAAELQAAWRATKD